MNWKWETTLDRRKFIGIAAGSIAATLERSASVAESARRSLIGAIAFDAFVILDPRPVFALAGKLFPGKGTDLSNAWRARQFEYTWLRTAGERYDGFWQVTEDALVFAARSLKLDLDAQRRERLMNAFLRLEAWPDVPETLRALKASGIRLAFLSNFSHRMLEAGIQNSGLNGTFEHLLSTDAVKQFKPAPRAYQMAVDAFRLPKEEILFVAFAGWDVAGARWFGFPTVWMNRAGAPAEELSAVPDFVCQDLPSLAGFVTPDR